MRALPGVLLLLLSVGFVCAEPAFSDFRITPDQPIAGQPLRIQYSLESDDRLGRVRTQVQLPQAINHVQIDTAGQAYDFDRTFPIPEGFSGEESLLLRIQVRPHPVLTETYDLFVRALPERTVTGPRAERIRSGQGVDVHVVPIRNLERDTTVLFPVTLTNNEPRSLEVVLGMEGVRGWGSYAVLPEPGVALGPGEERLVHIQISVHDDAPLGSKDITLTAEYDGKLDETDTSVAVLAKEEAQDGVPGWVWWLIGVLVLVALIIIGVAWYRKKEGEDEDLITYY